MSYQWNAGERGTYLDSREMVKGIYGDYKVEEKVAKNSNSLVVTSSSG